jgi:hypothetical protein
VTPSTSASGTNPDERFPDVQPCVDEVDVPPAEREQLAASPADEIARRKGVPKNTVYQWFYRAKELEPFGNSRNRDRGGDEG